MNKPPSSLFMQRGGGMYKEEQSKMTATLIFCLLIDYFVGYIGESKGGGDFMVAAQTLTKIAS